PGCEPALRSRPRSRQFSGVAELVAGQRIPRRAGQDGGGAPLMAGGGAARDEGLDRGIGTYALATATVNAVIGAGIFSLPAGMARAAGPDALIAYLVCAAAMAAVVLCFAEAGSRVPTSGGPSGTVEAAFGPLAGFVSGVL